MDRSRPSRRELLKKGAAISAATASGVSVFSGSALAGCQDHECVRTQGFWKNHDMWPVSSLTLGDTTYSESELRDILGTPARGDKTIILAYQLIAAELNLAAGTDPSCIEDTIDEANAWLAEHGPIGSDLRDWNGGEDLKDRLDAYNNGRLCACAPSEDDGGSGGPGGKGRGNGR